MTGIVTDSFEAGLDFACIQLVDLLSDMSEKNPEKAASMLRTLAFYIEFRYVGELELACENLFLLGRDCNASQKFWDQIAWCVEGLGYSLEEFSLKMKNERD